MLKWKKEPQTYGGNHYVSHDGNYRLHLSSYHPTAKYAHNYKNKSWWTLSKKDTKLGVAPDYMVQHRSFHSLKKAKDYASEWAARDMNEDTKYKSVYPTLRQAKTRWSKPSIIAKQGEGPSHDWYDLLKKDARAKLAASIVQSKMGSTSNQTKIYRESVESKANSEWVEKAELDKKPKKIKEDKIGKQSPSVEDIAKKHGLTVDQVNAQLDKGVPVEREHTNSDEEAREIARDHVHEFPDYYDRLDKMEKNAKKDIKEGYDPEKEILKNRIEAHKQVAEKMAQKHGTNSQEAIFHRALVKRWEKEMKEEHLKEDVVNSVGGGNIAGMPTKDSPENTPVGKSNIIRRKKFAGKQVFVVDPTTFHKAYLGKRKYEHYERYLDGCDIAEEIREYGRKYWDEPIIIENEQTGAMVYLKYGSK